MGALGQGNEEQRTLAAHFPLADNPVAEVAPVGLRTSPVKVTLCYEPLLHL